MYPNVPTEVVSGAVELVSYFFTVVATLFSVILCSRA